MSQIIPSAHPRSELYHDCSKRHAWRHYYHDLYQRIGNELSFSPGFGLDLWHALKEYTSIGELIFIFFLFETSFIVLFGVLLYITSGVTPLTFEASLIASTRAITQLGNWSDNQFPFLYGSGIDSNSMEVNVQGVIILIMQGWIHFLWACVASSLIIVKALVPMQQVAFSHHAVLTENELVVRIRLLRPLTTVLVRPEIKMDVCVTSGSFVKLPIIGGGSYAKWSGNPVITIRHTVNEDSPFYQKPSEDSIEKGAAVVQTSLDHVAHLSCSLTATDEYGLPIAEVQQYTPMVGFSKMWLQPYLAGEYGEQVEKDMPQIIHQAKFMDQITFGSADPEQLRTNSPDRVLFGLLPHPHGTNANMEVWEKRDDGWWRNLLRRWWPRVGRSREELIPVKRLVTNTDNFCRLVDTRSEEAKKHNSWSTAAGSSAVEAEKKLVNKPSSSSTRSDKVS